LDIVPIYEFYTQLKNKSWSQSYNLLGCDMMQSSRN